MYYDGMHNDTRMNLMIALTSAQSGATAANYVGLRDLVKDSAGRITGAVVEDTLTGATWNVKARVVVNATGPFADAVRLMDDVTQAEAIVPAAGVHVVMADHFCPDKMGLIVPKTQDGRVLFFLPWEGHALCGTTDSPAELSMTPEASEEDVSFILKEANRYLTTNVSRGDVKATWSGLRPLVKSSDTLKAETESIRAAVAAATEAGEDASAAATAARQGAGEGRNTSNFVRSHCVEVSDSGLVSILGGKWTTYRAMAQDTIDEVAARPRQFPLVASKVQPSDTLNKQLLGADRQGIVASQKFDRIVVRSSAVPLCRPSACSYRHPPSPPHTGDPSRDVWHGQGRRHPPRAQLRHAGPASGSDGRHGQGPPQVDAPARGAPPVLAS